MISRSQRLARQRAWYRKNRKRQIRLVKRYYRKHKKQILASRRRWDRAHPDRVLARHLMRTYKMPLSEFRSKYRAQKGRCAICRKRSRRRLSVDHNHRTLKRRGLLCDSCNLGLGKFLESIRLLKRAVAYLKRFQ